MGFRRPLQRLISELERDPDATAIVAAAFMIVAPVAVAAIPALMEIIIVRMIVEPHAWGAITAFGMPAIAIAIAGDIGGSRCGQRHQRSGADHGAEDKGLKFHQNGL